jgi:TonB-dependent SusC/RagA subfamily outer membrane receptor
MNLSKLVRPTLVGLFACLFLLSSQAQNKTITGKVTDSKDGSPMVGASVTVKGSTLGTQTGADGAFRISVPASANTLVISSVGYGSQEVSIQGRTSVDVRLNATNDQLNDVVVIGYGTARKRDQTGAVVSITAKNFNQGQITAPDQLLQSKVAGLEVTNQNGQPGAASTIQIRGTSSIRSNNNPLYVVDGVPLDGGTARPNLGNAFGSNPNSNPLLFIDPNSIAEISVLKDASSAAIYGSRGANGVIMITTKKGSAGPMRVEVGVNYGITAGYMKKFEIMKADEYRAALKKFSQPSTFDGAPV